MILLSNSKKKLGANLLGILYQVIFFILTKEFDKLLQALYLSKEELAKTLYEFLRSQG